MFTVVPSSFDQTLECTTPVHPNLITNEAMRYFDKDGFELTPLEIELYRANGVYLSDCLYNIACQKPWILQTDTSTGVTLDHSMLLQRYQVAGDARKQIETARSSIPSMVKLLATRQKWGIDFSVDYIDDTEVMDLFHVEIDSYNLEEINDIRERVASIITAIDWVDGARSVRAKKDQWQHLEGHAQSNWKARFFGFNAAEEIRKAF
jgi:hypothetical protein